MKVYESAICTLCNKTIQEVNYYSHMEYHDQNGDIPND